MSNYKKLSIIIVNYRSDRYLKSCLASIYNSWPSGLSLEIKIVNNDPLSHLGAVQKEFPLVSVIDLKENVGFGRGHNLGAAQSSGQYLLFLNPDTRIIDANWQKVFDELADARISAVGVQLKDQDGEMQKWSAGREINLWDIFLNNIGFPRSRKIWQSTEKTEADWVSGTAMFVRRQDFEKLGGFDEKIFMYFEDIDLCRRMRLAGRKVIYYPKFSIEHLGGASFLNPEEQKKIYYRSQDYYFQKHFGKIQAGSLRFLRKIFAFPNR